MSLTSKCARPVALCQVDKHYASGGVGLCISTQSGEETVLQAQCLFTLQAPWHVSPAATRSVGTLVTPGSNGIVLSAAHRVGRRSSGTNSRGDQRLVAAVCYCLPAQCLNRYVLLPSNQMYPRLSWPSEWLHGPWSSTPNMWDMDAGYVGDRLSKRMMLGVEVVISYWLALRLSPTAQLISKSETRGLVCVRPLISDPVLCNWALSVRCWP
jgi:hypothetical protein